MLRSKSIAATGRPDFILSEKKLPKPLLANAITAFRHAPEWAGLLAFDAFHARTMLRGRAPWMENEIDKSWTGAHDVLAADWLQHQGICVSPDVAGQAVEAVAGETRFHPVLDYLGRCKWDGENRLENWGIKHLGAADNGYTRAVSAKWMIGAVARVSEPGCKNDCAIILEGPQGLGKSTALKALSQPWFTDEIADLGTKDAALQLAGVWILELAELDSMARGDVSKIKGFMSRTTDRFRPPYARRVVEQPRQCVFAGTVNHNEYLRDETGGRRFWPLSCTQIDVDGLALVRDQLWAEARDRYLASEAWWLEGIAINKAANDEQRGRYQSDAWEQRVEQYIINRRSVSVSEVLENALNLAAVDWTQINQNRVARCLRALGWERHQQRDADERRQWRYFPPLLSPDA